MRFYFVPREAMLNTEILFTVSNFLFPTISKALEKEKKLLKVWILNICSDVLEAMQFWKNMTLKMENSNVINWTGFQNV